MNIITNKIGAGHYEVIVTEDGEMLGIFNLTDMQILEDIKEFAKDGYEDQLTHFESFDEVEEYITERL